jgi:hypothetical protein
MVTDPRFTKAVSGFVQVYKDNEVPSVISGDSLTLTLCNRTATTSNLGNYFVSVNLPAREYDLPKYQSLSIFYPELQQLNVDDIILMKIPNTAYTEFIDARSVELNVPVTGYSMSSLTLFSSTYTDAEYAQKYGETSPLLGDNIAYLFCDSINLPYTGLTVDDMGVVQSHAGVKSWNPPSRNYRDRPSAVSYSEVKGSNDTINTDRRYRINKSVFVDGLYQDFRGNAASYYDTFSSSYSQVSGKAGLAMLPGTNYFKVNDYVTLDEFDHLVNPTYSGDVRITAIYRGVDIGYIPENSPIQSSIYDIFLTDKTGVNAVPDSGTAYLSGGTYYNYDIPVGFVILDMGLVVITHRDIVNNIDWSAGYLPNGSANPSSGTTNVHFTGNSTTIYGDIEPRSIMNFTSLDTVFQMKATCNCLLGEFFISNNSTWYSRTIGQPLAEDDPVSVTEVGLYNELNELVGVTKFSEPILKGALDLLTFEIDINL